MSKRKQINLVTRKNVFEKYDSKCCSCKETQELVIHHIVPIGVGGTDEETNLCLVCSSCHKKIHENYNHINFNGKPPGRKRIIKSGYKTAIKNFFYDKRGSMSINELKTALGLSLKSDLKQNKIFIKEMHDIGISDYRINVDYMRKFNKPNNCKCGWIKFLDGRIENVYYSAG